MSIQDLIAVAKANQDQSEVKTGGDFEYVPPVAGPTFARFIEYIELGKHVKKYLGKDKPSASQVRVVFELVHPKNIKEIEVEGGGKKKIADRIKVDMPLSMSDKSKFYKLFKIMQAGRSDITHMAEMLNEGFIVIVKHNADEKNPKIVYANIWDGTKWDVQQPVQVDVLAGTTTKLPVPEPISPLKIFLWDNPTKDTWDSLFIDGERDIKDDKGVVTGKESKNKTQELLLSATDYPGSALNVLLQGVDLPTEEVKTIESTAAVQTSAVLPSEPKVETVAATVDSAADALAALGLS